MVFPGNVRGPSRLLMDRAKLFGDGSPNSPWAAKSQSHDRYRRSRDRIAPTVPCIDPIQARKPQTDLAERIDPGRRQADRCGRITAGVRLERNLLHGMNICPVGRARGNGGPKITLGRDFSRGAGASATGPRLFPCIHAPETPYHPGRRALLRVGNRQRAGDRLPRTAEQSAFLFHFRVSSQSRKAEKRLAAACIRRKPHRRLRERRRGPVDLSGRTRVASQRWLLDLATAPRYRAGMP